MSMSLGIVFLLGTHVIWLCVWRMHANARRVDRIIRKDLMDDLEKVHVELAGLKLMALFTDTTKQAQAQKEKG